MIPDDECWPEDCLKEARKGPWEEFARDRSRFRKRILEYEYHISWICYPNHRKKMRDILDDSYDKLLQSSPGEVQECHF